MVSNRTVTVIPEKDKKASTNKKRVKVAAYARVSTEKDDQLNSLEIQKRHYTEYIKSNKEWKFVGIYYDEGISGLNIKKRDGFNKMVADALDGNIDLILTKSISRFARNVVDTLQITRKLKLHDIGVIFEKENLNSLDSTSDFVLSVLASAAEEESKTISSTVRWGIRQNFKEGRFTLAYSTFLGYKKGKNKYEMVIDETQEPIVRLIYRLFLEKNSPYSIAATLNKLNIPSPKNSKWRKNVIISILSNEKYMGDALLQKSFVKDIYTHKAKKNEGELKQYYIKNSHEAIISKEVYNEVQERLKILNKHSSSMHTYSSLLTCDSCKNYYRIAIYNNLYYKESIKQWICCNKRNKDIKCNNIVLYEDLLDYVVRELFFDLFNGYPRLLKEINICIKKVNNEVKDLIKPLFPLNEEIIKTTFRTITKTAIVKPDRTLTITLIDNSKHLISLPEWSLVNKRPKDSITKEKIIAEYVPGIYGYKKLARKYKVPISTVRCWLKDSHR